MCVFGLSYDIGYSAQIFDKIAYMSDVQYITLSNPQLSLYQISFLLIVLVILNNTQIFYHKFIHPGRSISVYLTRDSSSM